MRITQWFYSKFYPLLQMIILINQTYLSSWTCRCYPHLSTTISRLKIKALNLYFFKNYFGNLPDSLYAFKKKSRYRAFKTVSFLKELANKLHCLKCGQFAIYAPCLNVYTANSTEKRRVINNSVDSWVKI